MKKSLPISLCIGFLFFTLGVLSAQRWVASPASKGLLPPEYYVVSIKVVDSLTIWALANHDYVATSSFNMRIIKTTNGGQTWWTSDVPVNLGVDGYDIEAVDSSTAWISGISSRVGSAVGVPNISKTTDGGRTWRKVATARANHLRFFDRNNGVAIAPPNLNYTSDGGETWTNRTTAFSNITNIGFSFFATNGCTVRGDTLWQAGGTGQVFKSTNKGRGRLFYAHY